MYDKLVILSPFLFPFFIRKENKVAKPVLIFFYCPKKKSLLYLIKVTK